MDDLKPTFKTLLKFQCLFSIKNDKTLHDLLKLSSFNVIRAQSSEFKVFTVWECWESCSPAAPPPPAPWRSDCPCPSPASSAGSSPSWSCNLQLQRHSAPAALSSSTCRDLTQCYAIEFIYCVFSITFSSIWKDKRWNAKMVVTSNGRNFHLKWESVVIRFHTFWMLITWHFNSGRLKAEISPKLEIKRRQFSDRLGF